MAKTSSDPERAAKNNLSDLRRALGIVRIEPKTKGEPEMPAEQLSVQETPKTEALKDRIEAVIAKEELAQERLLAEAQSHERKVHMLKALLPFTDDPATEGALRGVLPAIDPPPSLVPTAPPEPPQQITSRVQVTRQLVFAATQTFEDSFTINDLMARMANGAVLDRIERTRVRSSISQAMITLFERGEVIRVSQGWGKTQAIWRKASLNSTGNSDGDGVGARG
jgi:hypothetical protein